MARNDSHSPAPDLRPLPHSLDAERAVLGTFFLSDRTVADVQSLLEPVDFYDPRHQEIYKVVLELAAQDKPIDLMLLANECTRRGVLEKVGGVAYLAGLEQAVITPGNVRHHAEIVHEKALLRRLIRTTTEISDDATAERKETKALLIDAERKIFEILSGRVATEFRSVDEEANEVYQDLERRTEDRRDVTGVPTGIPGLDQLTGGFQKSDLIILAARPSVGKTSMALNMAVAAAKSHLHAGGSGEKPTVGVFSLEMNRRQIIQRIVSTEAKIPMDLLRKNRLNEAQLTLFRDTLEAVRNLDLYINDTPGLSSVEMRLHAQRLKSRRPNLSLVIVDYLQLMSGSSKRVESRQQEVSEISRALKGLARDLNVPVIALSQLSRNIESRSKGEAKPRLSDLRESGAIEQDADVVMFIHRLVARDSEAVKRAKVIPVDLIVAKQRNGPVGEVGLLFREEFTEFVRREDERR